MHFIFVAEMQLLNIRSVDNAIKVIEDSDMLNSTMEETIVDNNSIKGLTITNDKNETHQSLNDPFNTCKTLDDLKTSDCLLGNPDDYQFYVS